MDENSVLKVEQHELETNQVPAEEVTRFFFITIYLFFLLFPLSTSPQILLDMISRLSQFYRLKEEEQRYLV